MKKLFKQTVLLSLLLGLITMSCNQSGNKKKVVTNIDKEEIQTEIEEVMYPLPSPFELTQMLNDIEATFIFGITNPPENTNRYLTQSKQALNLGIYSSDLAYAATYNFSNEVQLFLDAVKDLAKELDVAGAIDQDLLTRIENSINNKENIVEVVTDLFYKTYSYLHKNNNTELSYLILVGTWLEGLYLTTNISENTFDNINIVKVIMKQEESLNKVLQLLEKSNEDENILKVYNKLSEISDIYNLQEGSNSLTQSQVKKISEAVNNYRTEIVE